MSARISGVSKNQWCQKESVVSESIGGIYQWCHKVPVVSLVYTLRTRSAACLTSILKGQRQCD